MIAVFILIQNVLGYFFSNNSSSPALVINENGVRPISSNYLMNVMRPGDKFSFDTYLSFMHPH